LESHFSPSAILARENHRDLDDSPQSIPIFFS
jgi:hypothetical protein